MHEFRPTSLDKFSSNYTPLLTADTEWKQLTHLFNNYYLKIYSAPGTVLNTGNAMANTLKVIKSREDDRQETRQVSLSVTHAATCATECLGDTLSEHTLSVVGQSMV